MPRIRTVKPEMWLQVGARPEAAYSIYCISEFGAERNGPCKIGIATYMGKRLSSLQCGNWRPLTLVWQIHVADRNEAKNVEHHCLMKFRPNCYSSDARLRLESEWITCAPLDVLQSAVEYLNLTVGRVEKVA